MKKNLIVFNILCLILTSCSSNPIITSSFERKPSATSESCTEMVTHLLSEKRPLNTPLKDLAQKLKIDLSEAEGEDISQFLSVEDLAEKDLNSLRGLLLFSKDNHEMRVSLLNEFQKKLNNQMEISENKHWALFLSHQKKIEGQAKKFLKKDARTAFDKSLIFEKLYYSCKAQVKSTPTADDLKQAKRLTYALTFGAAGSTATTYTAVNWEQEKDSKWFNELYFTLAMSLVSNFLISKYVLSNPNLTPWKQRMPLTFLSVAFNDLAITGAYGYLFGASNAEMEKKLKDLQNDPKAQERLNEILKIAQEHGLFEKYIKETQALFKDKKTGQAMQAKDFEKEVSIEDVDIEESRALLMAAIAEKEYADKSGVLSLGSKTTDRFSYNRLYNILSIPTSIGVSLLMNNQMCMSADPKLGFAKAVATYMAASLIFDALYFKGRRELINQ